MAMALAFLWHNIGGRARFGGCCKSRRHSGARSVNRNLEIPRCAIAHLRSGPEPVIGPRCARTRWDRPGNDVGAKKRPACASLLRYRCVLSAAMAATMVLPAARSELDRLQLDAGDAGCDVQSG